MEHSRNNKSLVSEHTERAFSLCNVTFLWVIAKFCGAQQLFEQVVAMLLIKQQLHKPILLLGS